MSSNSAQAPTPYYATNASRSRILFPSPLAARIRNNLMRRRKKRRESTPQHTCGARRAVDSLSLSLSLAPRAPSLVSRCNSPLPVAVRFAVGEIQEGRASCCSGRRGQARLLTSRACPTDVCYCTGLHSAGREIIQ